MRFCDECKPTVARCDSSEPPDAELYLVFQTLVAIGHIRPTGQYKDNEMLYEAVPYAEMSDEAKAYSAYFDSLEGRTSVN
jgi:hypothetical protein